MLGSPSQTNDPITLIDQAASLHDRKHIHQIIDHVEQLIKNPLHPLTLQKKAHIAKKAYDLEKNYYLTHSMWGRLLNHFATKFLHIQTDYDVIDGLHHIESDLDKKHLFVQAIEEGDTIALQDFLDAGFSPNYITNEGESAFLIAAEHGKMDCIQSLLNAGADINLKHAGNKTTLMLMVSKPSTPQNRAVIEYLVSHGADMSVQDTEDGYTALHWCIAAGQIENLRLLLQDNADSNILSSKKIPPLLEAAQRNQLSAIPLLLQYRADPNAQDANGNTPLHDCAQPYHLEDMSYIKGKLEAVKTLLTAGADPYIENKNRQIPLDICSEHDRDCYAGNEIAEMFFTLLCSGTPEDNIKSAGRKEFARQCIDFEKGYSKIIEYKKILLSHTDWMADYEKERDVDYLKILLENRAQKERNPVINKTLLKRDIIIKIGEKDYPVNGILLELESGFLTALQSPNENIQIRLYDYVPDFISNQQFEKVLSHIEGTEELKDPEQVNSTYFHLKPFSKSIPSFSEFWDTENNQPKTELADMEIVCNDNQIIKVHKSILSALNQDYLIDFVVQADAKTTKDFLRFLYTGEAAHIQTEKDIIDIANLCNAFNIQKQMMTRLGTRYYELALPKLLIYPDPTVSLSEIDKFVLKNLPVGRLRLNDFPSITAEQFISLIKLMPPEFAPQLECAQCFKLKLEDISTFQDYFKVV